MVLSEGLTYNVYEYDADEILEPWQSVEEGLTDASYEVSLNKSGPQTLRHFAVSALNGAGEGNRAFAPAVIAGAPYTIPYRAGFAPASDKSLWWIPVDAGNNQFVRNGQQASDGDAHCMMFTSYNPDVAAELYSGKIALAGTQDAEVVFSHNATANSTDRVEVTVRQPGSAEETIGVVDYRTSAPADGSARPSPSRPSMPPLPMSSLVSVPRPPSTTPSVSTTSVCVESWPMTFLSPWPLRSTWRRVFPSR